MKILIATGIFEPEIGGPATYTHMFGHKLAWPDTSVTIVTFSSIPPDPEDSKRMNYKVVRVVRGNRVLNRIRFFFKVWEYVRESDCIYMLDWFAAGLPTALAARFLGKPYVVRVGGDYLWEQRYLESEKKPLPLTDFYKKGMHRWWRYRIFLWLISWVLSNARHVVFNSDKQRELYERHYRLKKTSTIYNPVPRITIAHNDLLPDRKEFVFWGRFIVMKNLDTLVRAFAKAKLPPDYTLTLIGNGPRKGEIASLVAKLGIGKRVNFIDTMALDDAWNRVKDSRALVLPSWTDISPNQVYEALALGLPALVTKENYLSIRDQLPEMIDPRSVEDVASKLEMLADDVRYADFVKRWNAIRFNQTWDDVLKQHMSLFSSIL